MKIYAIIGAASSGKTTTIRHLEKMGFPVMHEIAREVIKEGVFQPKTVEFQEEAAKRHLERELEVRAAKHDVVFLDRGLYDTTAYCRYFNLGHPNALNTKLHYDAVFVLESLGSPQKDGVRIEKDLNEALALKNLILEEYNKRNIPLIHVPVMSVDERVKFILKHI